LATHLSTTRRRLPVLPLIVFLAVAGWTLFLFLYFLDERGNLDDRMTTWVVGLCALMISICALGLRIEGRIADDRVQFRQDNAATSQIPRINDCPPPQHDRISVAIGAARIVPVQRREPVILDRAYQAAYGDISQTVLADRDDDPWPGANSVQ